MGNGMNKWIVRLRFATKSCSWSKVVEMVVMFVASVAKLNIKLIVMISVAIVNDILPNVLTSKKCQNIVRAT